MNATLANNEMSHVLPAGLGYRSTMEEAARMGADARRDAGRTTGLGLARRVGDAVAWLVGAPRRHAVLSELGQLSDHELSDIGISRCDLKRVFDPSFAREHALRRSVYAPRVVG